MSIGWVQIADANQAHRFYLVFPTPSYDRWSLLSYSLSLFSHPGSCPPLTPCLCGQRWNSITSLRVVKAQTVRVNLFANAVATSMRRLPASILASHAPIGGLFRIARRITAIDPVINSRRLSRRPIFEVRPNLAKFGQVWQRIWRPLVGFCRGNSPHQAAHSRPFAKVSI